MAGDSETLQHAASGNHTASTGCLGLARLSSSDLQQLRCRSVSSVAQPTDFHWCGCPWHPAGKAFFADETSHDVAKMDFGDVADGIVFVDEHFHLILPPSDDMPSIDYILDKARAAVLR